MVTANPITRAIFRAYDIRGIIGEQLDENVFYQIGRAISLRLYALNRSEVFVARDGRLSSEGLVQSLTKGLIDSGIHVTDLGAVGTPVMYYAASGEIDSGLIVTGSHNPSNYNGLKIVLAGKTLQKEDIELIYDLVIKGKYQDGNGSLKAMSITDKYIERILSEVKLARPLKVVVDCGNGIAGLIAPHVIAALGCEVIPLYCEVDGNFPNHHPDPSVESNLDDLKILVKKHQADLGLAFDGDADRLGVVTDEGHVIWPDRLLMLYAREVLKNNQGATIVYDVKCSSNLEQVILASGGNPKMCPTGHSIVKGIMKSCSAILAGELSGHIFFKDRWYGFDDALYSACRLLEILGSSNKSITEQFTSIPNSVNTPEIKIPIPEEDKFTFMQRFVESASFPDARIIAIDGMRAEFADGWGLLRASNTTPCLVARFEAKDRGCLLRIQNMFKLQLLNIKKDLKLSF